MNSRAIAAFVLQRLIQQGASLPRALHHALEKHPSEDVGFIKELCFGTCRFYFELEAIAHQLLHKALPKKHQDIFLLILVGLYQIKYLDTPDYAAVSETVKAAKQLQKSWATALVNKVLREFIKQKETIQLESKQAYYAHPQWLIDLIAEAWPKQRQSILNANNERPPLFLRVNPQKITTQDYLQILKEQSIKATAIDQHPHAIKIEEPIPTEQIPGFSEGLFSVQDLAGQGVIDLLALQSGLTLLDACCAPGSKTSHILETQPDIEKIVSIDNDPERLQKVKHNIDRLQLPHQHCQLVLADASSPQQWWDGKQFDRILLDAPCSATGVIRRHPDIKLLRRESDIEALTKTQSALLNALWPTLKKNGRLIYTTCSVLPQENQQTIQRFLTKHKDAEKTFEQQLFPSTNGPDGFYYAVLQKN